MDIDKNLDLLYEKFCEWYEDDGSYDEQIKANLKAEILKLIEDNYVRKENLQTEIDATGMPKDSKRIVKAIIERI